MTMVHREVSIMRHLTDNKSIFSPSLLHVGRQTSKKHKRRKSTVVESNPLLEIEN